MLSVLMLVFLSWNASSSSSFFLPVFLARCRVEHIYECLLSRSAALEVARLIAPPRQEAEEAGDERARAEEERKKKLELALHLDDRRFNTAEANDSYIKFVRHLADEIGWSRSRKAECLSVHFVFEKGWF